MEIQFLPPSEIMRATVQTVNHKLGLSLSKQVILSLLAGAYIALGAHFYTTAISLGLSKLVGGAVFSLGLILVVVAGAELFTGNMCLIINKFQCQSSFISIIRSWLIVYFFNFLGALLVVALIFYSGLNGYSDHLTPIGKTALSIAETKANLSFIQIFIRAILANWLVCLAIILATSSRDIVSKMLACTFPVMAFVAMGFEHSVANMYFLPAGMILSSSISLLSLSNNLLAATAGNMFGGIIFVWLAYWYLHLRN